MVFIQYGYRRRAWAKRVASVFGVVLVASVAGCSSANERFGYYGDGYGPTGAVPVPPEPVYGGSYRGSGAGYYSHQASRHAPFNTASYSSSEPAGIERSSLAPVASYGDRSVGSSYAKSNTAGYPRYASNTTAGYGGSMFTMQPVRDDGSYDNRYDRRQNSEDDYRSPPGRYDGEGRHGTLRPSERQYRAQGEVYVVERGDTLYSIAKRYGMTTNELMEMNNLVGSDIHPGQQLRVNGYTASNAQPRQSGRDSYDGDRNAYQRNGSSGYDADRYGRNSYSGNSYDRNAYGNDSYRGYGNEAYGRSYGNYGNSGGSYSNSNRAYASGNNGYNGDTRDYARKRGGYDRQNRYEEEAALPKRRTTGYDRGSSRYDGQSGRGNAARYTVRRGDTLMDIARRNGISHRELADYNDIPSSATLYPGQILRIPQGRGYDWSAGGEREGANRQAPSSNNKAVASVPTGKAAAKSKPVRVAEVRADPIPEVTGGPGNRTAVVSGETGQVVADGHEETSGGPKNGPRECEALLANPLQRSAKSFREPVQGQIISKYGAKEDGSFNDGVNFLVPKGTPVKAVENGVVAYAGDELSGFGNLVLIRHADGFVSAYANNDELQVKRCDVVKRGQVIGKAGATGNVTKPQLHFELRKDSKPVDPEAYFARS